MEKLDVICVGTAIIDIPLYPIDTNILEQVSYPLDDISMKIGGDAINEATIITRLGNKVALMSVVGDDSAGHFIYDFAKKNNVNIEHLKVRNDLTTSINIGLVKKDGERTFLNNRNGSLWKMDISDIDLNSIRNAKILSLASIFNNPLLDNTALIKIFKQAKKADMIICADMVKSRLGEGLTDIKEALGYVDYFFPNYDEAKELTNKTELTDIANTFLDLGVKNIVIKTGKKGCFIKNRQIEKSIPAFTKDKSTNIDTTGAGDNFVSGFISELVRDQPFEICARFGNAVAAVSVEGLGATAAVKNRQQVEDMIKNYTEKD